MAKITLQIIVNNTRVKVLNAPEAWLYRLGRDRDDLKGSYGREMCYKIEQPPLDKSLWAKIKSVFIGSPEVAANKEVANNCQLPLPFAGAPLPEKLMQDLLDNLYSGIVAPKLGRFPVSTCVEDTGKIELPSFENCREKATQRETCASFFALRTEQEIKDFLGDNVHHVYYEEVEMKGCTEDFSPDL